MPFDSSGTVLDRLLMDTPSAEEIGSSSGDEIRDSIARDLEVLLNCRRPADLVPAEYPETATSILNFGVPEFDQFGNLSVPAEQAKLCGTFEAAIRTFEPRLRNVTVRLLPPGDNGGVLRFHIEGVIAAYGDIGTFEAGVKQHTSTISVLRGGGA